jgi:hypothetical protein
MLLQFPPPAVQFTGMHLQSAGVYITNLGFFAYDLNGKQVWHTPLEAYPIYLDFGTGASPVLWGDMLVIVNDNEKQQFIAAFDKNTGKQIWRANRDLGAGRLRLI